MTDTTSLHAEVRGSAPLLTLPTLIALIVTEAGGAAEAWARGSRGWFALTSLAVTAIAASAVAAADRGHVRAARGLSFAQLPFGVALISLSNVTVLVGLFPIVGVAEMTWPIVGSIAAISVFLPALAGVGALQHAASSDILARCGGFIGGTIFAVAFTRVAVAERRARGELVRLLRANEEANDRLREYATMASLLAAAEERNRIARDIHDGVGHGLTVVHVQLEAARAVSGDDPRAREVRACVERAQEAARSALADVRRSVGRLRDGPTRPLADDLECLVKECRDSGLDAAIQIDGEPREIPLDSENALRRAAQEALTNVRRHAQARSVRVKLVYTSDAVTLSVTDDGRGASGPGKGFGLIGMRERVELLGGSFEIRTSPDAGFAVEIRLSA
jgi:signal transduction histidine kinase